MPKTVLIKGLKLNGEITFTNAGYNVQLVKNTTFVPIPAPGPATTLLREQIVDHTVLKVATVQKVLFKFCPQKSTGNFAKMLYLNV